MRVAAGPAADGAPFALAEFVADAGNAALLDAKASGCPFTVRNVEPHIRATGGRSLLFGALMNLLQNAFKYTAPGTEVTLSARADGGTALIEVADHCGGLPPGAVETLFQPFQRRHGDKAGLGLGLTIARQSVESSGGTLDVRDLPGTGCVFSMRLPLAAG